jgi:UPF0755 protein
LRARQFFLLLFGIVLIFAVFVRQDYITPHKNSGEINVLLPRGIGSSKSIDLLAENGVIAHPLFFKIIAYANGNARKIKAGEYLFPSDISPKEVLKMLVSGKVVKHKITIAEGLNVREVFALLNSEQKLDGEIPENIAEGSLLPETYYFARGDTRASIISRMQEQMQKTIVELWDKREENLPFTTPEQALILASIVEKETGVEEERARVAAVFINRLRIGMKLQSDPTTAYGIEKDTGKKLDRLLTLTDLKTENPYNTYTISALPPTPICNVGEASLTAVLHPLQTEELYFVATGKGGHNFSKTIAEHEKNVAEYRKIIGKK